MTVLDVIQRSTDFLSQKGVESPRLQVELLLAEALGMPRLQLYLNFERQLSTSELQRMRDWIKRRAAREPLQHILGTTSFCGLEIKVSPQALIPRPETELLAERAWTFLKQVAEKQPARALDFGTGTGCLAIALAVYVPAARIYALDISSEAIELARENSARHQVSERIEFLQSEGFESLSSKLDFDVIVSNPPYIPSAEIETLAPEVRDHDPRAALDGGPDGLNCYRYLAEQSRPFLIPAGKMMLEFGDGQAEPLRTIFESKQWKVESIDPDLSGRLRMMTIM